MEKQTFVDRFKSPALWITILIGFVYVVIRLDKVDILEARLDKKIEIQNEHENQLIQHEIHFLQYQLKAQDELHELELEILETKYMNK